MWEVSQCHHVWQLRAPQKFLTVTSFSYMLPLNVAGQLRAAGVGIATREGAVELDEDTSDSRSHLIIELSSQISDQEYRMSRLESQLEEKDATILDLQQRLSQSSAHQSTGAKTGRGAQYLSQDVKVGKKKRSKVVDRKSTRLNSSHVRTSRMPSSAWKKKKK